MRTAENRQGLLPPTKTLGQKLRVMLKAPLSARLHRLARTVTERKIRKQAKTAPWGEIRRPRITGPTHQQEPSWVSGRVVNYDGEPAILTRDRRLVFRNNWPKSIPDPRRNGKRITLPNPEDIIVVYS